MDTLASTNRVKIAGLLSLFCFILAIPIFLSAPWTFYVAIVNFHNRATPKVDELETLSFKILQVSNRTPNFKVELSDGTRSYISFPDFMWLNGKGGLKFQQITDADREMLVGCLATAKVNFVSWYVVNHMQIWDLECPSKNIHYGPEVAGSGIASEPLADLAAGLFGSLVMLTIGYGMYALSQSLKNERARMISTG